jgi:hypothetical protein
LPCNAGNKSVSRILFFARRQSGNHSSRLFVTEKLERPTRKRCRFAPETLSGPLKNRFPIWSCTTRSLPSRNVLPRALTRSYRVVSPITLTGWFVFCCTCRRSGYRTPGSYPARCPLVFGLSSYKNLTSDCPTCFPFARLQYLSKKCSTITIMVYCFDLYLHKPKLIADFNRIAGFEPRVGNFPILYQLQIIFV